MKLKTAKIGFMGEEEILTLSTSRSAPEPRWELIDLEGIEGSPSMIYNVEENPNGGDYIALSTGRKPSRVFTVKLRVVGEPFALFQAQETINSLAERSELLKVVVDENFNEGEVTTTLDNCRISGDILTRISGIILEAQFTLVSKTAEKTIVIN